MEIIVKGKKVIYEDVGQGASIVLLHGWGSEGKFFAPIMSALKDRYRLIAPNFPGCGGSEIMDSPWSLADYEDFVLEFLNKLEIKDPVMMGHSHGGRVTLSLCAKGKVNPKKIVLLDSAGLIPKKTAKQKFRAKSFKAIKWFLTLPVIKNFSAGLLEKARKYYGSADYNAAPPVLRQTLISLVNTDLRDVLPNIKASTLLIWGENDTATPLADAKIIESLISDAGLCVIKGAGHFAFAEAPAQTIAILNSFLG